MVEIKSLSKSYGEQLVLSGVSLKLDAGDIGVLLGSSGSGKTTLLRLIAGLDIEYSGEIWLDSTRITPNVPPADRQVGLLFQNFALFPHLTAKENVLIALRRLEKSQREARANEVLEICGLSSEAGKLPTQMSGGQQQRLALARALAPRPRLLLMDEPFSSLDPELRSRLALEVRSLLKSQNVTSLIVTHQIEEAYDLADHIGILDGGKIVQWSTPYDLYHVPNSPYVAQYLERVSFWNVRVESDNELALGSLRFPFGKKSGFVKGQELKLLVRPDDVLHDDASPIKAKVRAKHFRGSWFLYELELEGSKFFSYVPSHHNHAIGESIGVRFEIDHLVCFPHSSAGLHNSVSATSVAEPHQIVGSHQSVGK